MAALRTCAAVATLALLLGLVEGLGALRIGIRFDRFVGLGLMMAGFFAIYAVGIYFSNPITAAAISVAGPLVSATTVRVVTGAPFDKGFGVALSLTVLGGLILASGSLSGAAHVTFGGGEIIVLFSSALWALYSIKAQVWFEPRTVPAAWRGLGLDRRTRMLYDERHVYINGEAFRAAGRDATLMRALANRRALGPRELARASEGARALLDEWCAAGWLHAD